MQLILVTVMYTNFGLLWYLILLIIEITPGLNQADYYRGWRGKGKNRQ